MRLGIAALSCTFALLAGCSSSGGGSASLSNTEAAAAWAGTWKFTFANQSGTASPAGCLTQNEINQFIQDAFEAGNLAFASTGDGLIGEPGQKITIGDRNLRFSSSEIDNSGGITTRFEFSVSVNLTDGDTRFSGEVTAKVTIKEPGKPACTLDLRADVSGEKVAPAKNVNLQDGYFTGDDGDTYTYANGTTLTMRNQGGLFSLSIGNPNTNEGRAWLLERDGGDIEVTDLETFSVQSTLRLTEEDWITGGDEPTLLPGGLTRLPFTEQKQAAVVGISPLYGGDLTWTATFSRQKNPVVTAIARFPDVVKVTLRENFANTTGGGRPSEDRTITLFLARDWGPVALDFGDGEGVQTLTSATIDGINVVQ